MKRRLVLLDPNLVDERGHHLAVTNRLAAAALFRAMDVHVLAHRDLADGKLQPGATLTRCFNETSYSLMQRNERRRDLASGIGTAIEGVIADGLLAGSALLIQSADGHSLRAVAARLPLLAATGATIHLATAYLPDTMPGGQAGPGVDGTLRALLHHPFYGKRVFLWAETARLARCYSAAYGAQVAWLPLPLPEWTEHLPSPQGPLTLCFLGSARDEKGFARLPEIVAAIGARTGGAVRFEIQACPPASGLSPACAAAWEALDAMPEVRLIRGALSERRYAALLARSDGVMLCYSPASYAVRGSGIAVEALAAGRSLLVTAGTEQAEEAPPALRKVASDADGWAALVSRLLADLPAHRARMGTAGAAFRRDRSAAAFLDRLFARETLGRLVAGDGIGAAPLPALVHLR